MFPLRYVHAHIQILLVPQMMADYRAAHVAAHVVTSGKTPANQSVFSTPSLVLDIFSRFVPFLIFCVFFFLSWTFFSAHKILMQEHCDALHQSSPE